MKHVPHPKSPTDLLLAPVAVEIDRNLQRLRDLDSAAIAAELDLELDRPESRSAGRKERRARVLLAALRNVNLHDWDAEITGDDARLHLHGGSVSLDIGLSATIARYIADGAR
jgi:hypothetical protein